MIDRTDHAWIDLEADEVDEAEPGWGWLARTLIVVLLAATGSGSAFIWHAMGGPSPVSQSTTPSATVMTEKRVSLGELEALRQQIVNLNQANQQLLATQQAEIKRLTDQVASLSDKLDLLQRPVTSAQAALQPPVVLRPAPAAAKKKQEAAKPETAKPVTVAKPAPKPVDTKPTGTVSIGGAPLQLIR